MQLSGWGKLHFWALPQLRCVSIAHGEKHPRLAAFLVKKDSIKIYLGIVPIMAKNVNS